MSSRLSLCMTTLHCARSRGSAPGPRMWSGQALEPGLEPAGVTLLGAGERFEPLGDLFEALVARGLRETRVHLGVLVGLTGDRRLQVVGRRADRNTGHGVANLGEKVEVAERVSGLAFRDRAEQGGHVGITLH